MHIGLIIYGSLDNLTGGWLYDRLLVENLRGRGHTVDVIAFEQRGYVPNMADNLSRRLYRRLVKSDYQLLLQDSLVHPSLIFLNRYIKSRHAVTPVTIVHQVLCRQPLSRFKQLFYRAVEQRYFRSVDGFIFNSDTTRANVEILVGRNIPAVVAPPGGDRLGCLSAGTGINTRSRRSGPLRLITVCNLTPNKGVLQLIEGLSRLPPEIWRLELVGSLSMDRAYVNRIKSLVARVGLENRIEMPGPLDGDNLAEKLKASQVFVLPFSYEGFGIACLEAMAWGLPVVGSSRGALKEYIRDGINGILIPPGDAEALVRHVRELHDDRARLAACSREALKTYHSRPTWQDCFQNINTFLLSLVK